MDDGLINNNFLWDDGDQPWLLPNSEGEEDDKKLKLQKITKKEDEQEAKGDQGEASKGKKRCANAVGGDNSNDGKGKESDHELHIFTERERRKKMRNMFASLHALLPHLPPKTDKSTIVDEAITYVKQLQQTLSKLQKQKLERGVIPWREAFLADRASTSVALSNVNINQNPLFAGSELPIFTKTWTSPNLVINVSGRDAQINVCGLKKPGLFTGICFLLEKYRMEVLSAQVSSDQNRCMYMIHTRAYGACEQFPQVFPIEEVYKQAAAELMLWVNS